MAALAGGPRLFFLHARALAVIAVVSSRLSDINSGFVAPDTTITTMPRIPRRCHSPHAPPACSYTPYIPYAIFFLCFEPRAVEPAQWFPSPSSSG